MRHGFELASAKVGYDVRLTEDFAFAPIVGADLNLFLWEGPAATGSAEGATFVYAGVQGRFDFGLAHGVRGTSAQQRNPCW